MSIQDNGLLLFSTAIYKHSGFTINGLGQMHRVTRLSKLQSARDRLDGLGDPIILVIPDSCINTDVESMSGAEDESVNEVAKQGTTKHEE
jgi:hypothetical protein